MSTEPNSALSSTSHARLKDLLRDVVLAVEIAGPRSRLVRRLRSALEQPEPDADYGPSWPWVPLSAEWWKLAGNRVAASHEQMRFAACWVACGDATRAARFAGLAEGAGYYKQAGYRALRSAAVDKLLRAAVREMQSRRIPIQGWKLQAYLYR